MSQTDIPGASMGTGNSHAPDVTEIERGRTHHGLRHLKTVAEVKAGQDAINVYVMKLPLRASSVVLQSLRDRVINQSTLDLQHLRRIVRGEYVPQNVRALFHVTEDDDDNGYMFICPVQQLDEEELLALLVEDPTTPFNSGETLPSIAATPVPLYAPTSASQAAKWSEKFWPISFKNTNPYGPHPSLVSRTEAELLGKTGKGVAEKMRLATEAARESTDMRMGPGVGCAVIARGQEWYAEEEIIAVGGDARWYHVERGNSSGLQGESGNVMAHAVMRAIGMIAQKRLRIASTLDSPVGPDTSPIYHEAHHDDAFLDTPLTPLEAEYYARDNLAPYGYLCCDLEIYITHEPCTMCSMAILHSRFARCIFGQTMLLTGAMTADAGGLGLGLFWRPSELNWKMLCWKWQDRRAETEQNIDEKLNA